MKHKRPIKIWRRAKLIGLPFFHPLPAAISVNIVKKKCDKADDHRDIVYIGKACQYPQNDQNDNNSGH